MEHNQFSDMVKLNLLLRIAFIYIVIVFWTQTDEEKAAYHGANPQSTPTPRDALFKTATVAEVRALPASVSLDSILIYLLCLVELQ